jgi:anti-anti-sigma factor
MTESNPQVTVGTALTPLIEVVITERLDSHAARRLRRMLFESLELRPERLVVDLTDCPFVDAAAVHVLLDAHREAWRVGGRLTLRSPSPRLTRLLELAHARDVFDITYDRPAHPTPVTRHRINIGERS